MKDNSYATTSTKAISYDIHKRNIWQVTFMTNESSAHYIISHHSTGQQDGQESRKRNW